MLLFQKTVTYFGLLLLRALWFFGLVWIYLIILRHFLQDLSTHMFSTAARVKMDSQWGEETVAIQEILHVRHMTTKTAQPCGVLFHGFAWAKISSHSLLNTIPSLCFIMSKFSILVLFSHSHVFSHSTSSPHFEVTSESVWPFCFLLLIGLGSILSYVASFGVGFPPLLKCEVIKYNHCILHLSACVFCLLGFCISGNQTV